MQIGFLGHQSWLVETESARILVDPVLTDTIGVDDQFGIQIYPPRTVSTSALKDVSAIIISHEHSDHFDLPSLNQLPRVPVYLGSTVVEPVERALKSLGFNVTRIENTLPVEVQDLAFRLYPCDEETPFWESRVNQVFFQSKNQNESISTFLIGVDALISKRLTQDVKKGIIPEPKVTAISNNSQITPSGVVGSLESITDNSQLSKRKNGLTGLTVLHSLISYIQQGPKTDFIIICGGGFMKNYDNFGPFPFSDQNEIANILQDLSLGSDFLGMLPGQYLQFTRDGNSQVTSYDWVKPNIERHEKLKQQKSNFLNSGRQIPKAALCGEFPNENEYFAALEFAEVELEKLVQPILVSKLGRHLMSTLCNQSLKIADTPFVIIFTNTRFSQNLVYGLNIHSGKFSLIGSGNDFERSFVPFGLEIALNDFYNMARGEIQIWDLAGVAIHSWYNCPEFEGPVPFMYSYYGENASPELFQTILDSKLSKMGILE